MSAVKFESESAPVPRAERLKLLAGALLVCALGIWLITLGGIGMHRLDEGAMQLIFWGGLIAAIGIVVLGKAIKRTHKTQLTAAGWAAKEAYEARQQKRAAQRNADYTAKAFGVAILAFCIYWVSPVVDMFESKIAVYPISCTNWLAQYGACAADGWQAGNPTTFIVHVDQQLVVGVTEGALAPEKLFNCVVADRRNWSCNESPDKESTQYIMTSGTLSIVPGPYSWPLQLTYVSRFKWWTTKLGM